MVSEDLWPPNHNEERPGLGPKGGLSTPPLLQGGYCVCVCVCGAVGVPGGTEYVASLGFSEWICQGQLSQPSAGIRMGRSVGSADPTQLSFKRPLHVFLAQSRGGWGCHTLSSPTTNCLVNDWRWWWWWCTCILDAAVSPPTPYPLTLQVHVEHASLSLYEMVVCVIDN